MRNLRATVPKFARRSLLPAHGLGHPKCEASILTGNCRDYLNRSVEGARALRAIVIIIRVRGMNAVETIIQLEAALTDLARQREDASEIRISQRN